MSHRFKTRLEQAHARGDYTALLDGIPYAQLIGIECTRLGAELLCSFSNLILFADIIGFDDAESDEGK